MWKKLSSKVIFEHSRITLLEDDVELPNGQKIQYLKFKSSGSAATIIAKNNKGKILLQKEYSYPPNETIYQFPGGSVPEREDLELGANRELMEEADLKADKLTFLGSYLMNNRRSESKMHVYLAEDLKEQSLDGDLEENIESFWFTEKEIDELILSGELKNGYSLAAWSLYKINRQNS